MSLGVTTTATRSPVYGTPIQQFVTGSGGAAAGPPIQTTDEARGEALKQTAFRWCQSQGVDFSQTSETQCMSMYQQAGSPGSSGSSGGILSLLTSPIGLAGVGLVAFLLLRRRA